MKNFCWLLLISILLKQTVTQIYTVGLIGLVSASAFNCIYQNGYTYAIIRAYSLDNGGSVDPNIVQTLQNAKKTHITTSIQMVICRNNDPISQITTMINSIPQDLYNFIFIKVIPNQVSGCQWPVSIDSHTANCHFLTKAIKQIKSQGFYPGVYSTAKIWNSFFGNSCHRLADIGAYLWYANQDQNGQLNSNPNIDDYEPFGGWSYPILKEVSGLMQTQLCGNPEWRIMIRGVLVV